ncbi:Bactofilin domain-containing protein [Desulfonema limicola]|uniref:Bactofilin domain-containing protein n=1 Tax=Desulfonema limicola TaxID=45656 RepID=A0A975B862_9BACT|nr:polymer-forming cytoskeletal protein [Desulfonema limicola]QTA80498.1 Bactofilin domain-containing protein [Desulfonema limicola]
MAKTTETISILSKGAEFEGNLSCTGKIIINGTIKGTLKGEFITIGEQGIVYAETSAKSLTIAGRFEGNLKSADSLTVLAGGYCDGDVTCHDLVVEPGGVLNGRVNRRSLKELPVQDESQTVKEPKAKK